MITLVSFLVPPWKICAQQTHGEKPLSGTRDDGPSFPWQQTSFPTERVHQGWGCMDSSSPSPAFVWITHQALRTVMEAPQGQKFCVRAKWYPGRRRGDSVYQISPGIKGQSSRCVHFNLIVSNCLLMSLKLLQKPLRYLILLHLLKWFRIPYACDMKALHPHDSLRKHPRGDPRGSAGIAILNRQKFPWTFHGEGDA